MFISEDRADISYSRRKGLQTGFLQFSVVVLMIGSRITRRWNQTGQKWAGEPDIAKTFFFEHRLFLWVLVASTYLWNLQVSSRINFPRFPQWAAGTISTTIVTAAVTFKLAFTHEDSPELLAGFAKRMADNGIGGALLVSRARIAFAAIGLAMLYTIVSGFSQARPNRKLLPFFPSNII
jgi:ethanolaminephosphotransferase